MPLSTSLIFMNIGLEDLESIKKKNAAAPNRRIRMRMMIFLGLNFPEPSSTSR